MFVASRVALGLLGLAALATSVAAEVTCTGPDDLCTGDPCVIPTLAVADPCVLDFGPRALVVAGSLTGATDGVLSLTAASITVDGSIRTRALTDFLVPEVTLVATAGDITFNGRLSAPNATSYAYGAHVVVQATGDVVADAPIVIGGHLPELTIGAGGDIVLRKRVGWPLYLTITAGGAIEIDARLRGGLTTIDAGGTLTMGYPAYIGSGDLRGAAGVTVRRSITSHEIAFSSSGGDVNIEGPVSGFEGGPVTVTAAGVARVSQRISLDAPTPYGGGTLSVTGAAVEMSPTARLFADGTVYGGVIRLTATAGDLTLDGRFSARAGGFSGGTIEGTATGDLAATGSFVVTTGGCIGLSAGGTLDIAAASFDVPVVPDCP
jgi:hypothetical protein